jgi:hypothetical protein
MLSLHPFRTAEAACACRQSHTSAQLVVVTGGTGAGKTAALEVARKELCPHVVILPEAATILFAGGFPRGEGRSVLVAAQRAIYWVEHELEEAVLGAQGVAVALCDRGSLDGLAYWPGDEPEFFTSLKTTREAELARYLAVIHLRTPGSAFYTRTNPMRIESAESARLIDARIEHAWRGHPRRYFVESDESFVDKTREVLSLIKTQLPACCREPTPPHPSTR